MDPRDFVSVDEWSKFTASDEYKSFKADFAQRCVDADNHGRMMLGPDIDRRRWPLIQITRRCKRLYTSYINIPKNPIESIDISEADSVFCLPPIR